MSEERDYVRCPACKTADVVPLEGGWFACDYCLSKWDEDEMELASLRSRLAAAERAYADQRSDTSLMEQKWRSQIARAEAAESRASRLEAELREMVEEFEGLGALNPKVVEVFQYPSSRMRRSGVIERARAALAEGDDK